MYKSSMTQLHESSHCTSGCNCSHSALLLLQLFLSVQPLLLCLVVNDLLRLQWMRYKGTNAASLAEGRGTNASPLVCNKWCHLAHTMHIQRTHTLHTHQHTPNTQPTHTKHILYVHLVCTVHFASCVCTAISTLWFHCQLVV